MMNNPSENLNQPLLRPLTIGDLTLKNRVVMSPMTRSRAERDTFLPAALTADYYAQRASAGLIISEGVWISPTSMGWDGAPGIYTEEQVAAWQPVTEAVHRAGGLIFAQLWHVGATSHPDFFNGAPPLSASAVNPGQSVHTPLGRKATETPRAMTHAEVKAVVADFATAARNAKRAGFDGVQLQAGRTYLLSQFLLPQTNQRTDEYGGSLENRARLLFEVLDALLAVFPPNRIGIRTGPNLPESGAFVSTADTLPTFEYVIERLSGYQLNHLMLTRLELAASEEPSLVPLMGDAIFSHFRKMYPGLILGNSGLDRAQANHLLEAGAIDMVAIGVPYIANPDLTTRFARNAPLNEVDGTTIYGGGAAGYTDYPTLAGDAA